jgi:hypothetical protein
LAALSKHYAWAKFLRLRASDADTSLDALALPVLQVYRAGKLEVNLVRAADAMTEMGGEDFTLEDCESVLQWYSFLFPFRICISLKLLTHLALLPFRCFVA